MEDIGTYVLSRDRAGNRDVSSSSRTATDDIGVSRLYRSSTEDKGVSSISGL